MQGLDIWVHTDKATKHWTEVADEPVWVSLAEAQAFCAAHNARLMSEEEYMRLLDLNGTSEKQRCPSLCNDTRCTTSLRSAGWQANSCSKFDLYDNRPCT